jgi:hypothetical protein
VASAWCSSLVAEHRCLTPPSLQIAAATNAAELFTQLQQQAGTDPYAAAMQEAVAVKEASARAADRARLAAEFEARVGLGRIVAVHDSSSTLYQIQ